MYFYSSDFHQSPGVAPLYFFLMVRLGSRQMQTAFLMLHTTSYCMWIWLSTFPLCVGEQLCVHVHDSQECPEFSVDMLHISCVDRENIHEMIDDFVFSPDVREEEGDKKKNRYRGRQWEWSRDWCLCEFSAHIPAGSSLQSNIWGWNRRFIRRTAVWWWCLRAYFFKPF